MAIEEKNKKFDKRKRGPQKGGRRNNNRRKSPEENRAAILAQWEPKTELGIKVRNKEVTDISEILENGSRIYESEIVDTLVPELESELLLLGQAKGKFGGGQRRAFRQTQKKTKEGKVQKFTTAAVVGNNNGYIGIGFGKSKETIPAREKSTRFAKLNIVKIVRGCGSWECNCKEPHTVPFAVTGKCGSVKVNLIPAPKGTGLVAEKEVAKILIKAGIVDIWSKSRGMTSSRTNLIKATMNALEKLSKTHTLLGHKEDLGLCSGRRTVSGDEE